MAEASDLTIQVLHKVREIIPSIVNGYAEYKDGNTVSSLIPSVGSRDFVGFMNGGGLETHTYDISIIGQNVKEMETNLNQVGTMFQHLGEGAITSTNNSFRFVGADVVVPPHPTRLVDDQTFEYEMTIAVRTVKLN